MGRVLAILAASLVVTALVPAGASARRVTVSIVTRPLPPTFGELGAVGLYVPGRGVSVSREEALEDLQADRLPVERPCARLARCPIEIFVAVPPLAAQPNVRRYQIAILGTGYHGLLGSDSTRIPGLVSIADVAPTVRALEAGGEPPIRAEPNPHARADLQRLDERLDVARRAQLPATVALTAILVALTALALAFRSRPLARAALLFPPAAILVALAVAGADATGPVATTAGVAAAALAALAVARAGDDVFALLTLASLAVYGIVLALSPETNALMAIGPHPWGGGRFYGVTNQTETLLLAPTLAAAVVFGGWQLVPLAALTLLVLGASTTGADGGGIVVISAAFVAAWLLLDRRPLTARRLAVAAVVVAAVALGFVGVDAAAGGSSHVVDAVEGGPVGLLEDLERRLRASVALATSSAAQLGVLVASLVALVWLAALSPRAAVVDAFLVALAVSLVVNDSPTKVAGYGAVLCAALRAWSARESAR